MSQVGLDAAVYRVAMTGQVADQARALVGEIRSRHETVEDDAFLKAAPTYAQELPRALRRSLNEFRLEEPAGLCVVSGWPVDEDRIGATPAHWEAKVTPSPALDEEI